MVIPMRLYRFVVKMAGALCIHHLSRVADARHNEAESELASP